METLPTRIFNYREQLMRTPQLNFRFLVFLMFCGTILAIAAGDAKAQNPFERGRQYYDQRAADADSFRANPAHIDSAIQAFQNAIDKDIHPEDAATYLLKSYYFKAMYTGLNPQQKKEIYDKGVRQGEKMMDRFPKSASIKFWYGANLGRWADEHGFFEAATNGVAKKLRRISKEIIKLDPKYQGGGGYRILAQVHFYSPNIPIIMGWPSDDRALELIEQAMAIAPEHPTNRMLYAQILLEFDRREEARRQLQYILDMEPRPTHIVEDRYLKHRSRQILSEQF